MTKDEVHDMMMMLLESAKKIREGYKYSGDEQMLPTAFIFGNEITIMPLSWKDDKEKYQMAAAANAMARQMKAKSLSFATDSRWVNSDVFAEYYKLPKPTRDTLETFQREYSRILHEHGGQVKNLPRQLWQEAVVVFTNGPGIPITIQMAPYEEGDYDTIRWLPRDEEYRDASGKSDMLTDWWS
jgi:hypothetical protein